MKKMLLVDGNSMLFRAYYATAYGRPMSTSNGIPTGAVFGFSNMLHKAIELIQPDYLCVAFDSAKKNFRHELFPEYKGGRKETPEDLVAQFSVVREFLDSWNIKRYEKEGIEADDIIGTIASSHPECEVAILSSDRDLLQIIDPTTSVWLMKKGISELEKIDEAALFEKYQISPSQIIDLKGLMGDASDNIPGIPSVGEKTAIKLLKQFETVEGVIHHADEIKGKLHDTILTYADQALLSKKLATIHKQAEIPFDVKEMEYAPDLNGLKNFYLKYEMNSLAKKIEVEEPEKKSSSFEVSMKQASQCPEHFLNSITSIVFVDETLNLLESVQGLALASGNEAVYMSLEDVKSDKRLLEYLKKSDLKIGFDCKRLMHWADEVQLEINHFSSDLMIASFLCDASIQSFDQMIEKLNLPSVSSNSVAEKAMKMASVLHEAYRLTENRLKEMELEKLYKEIEMPLIPILYEMEKAGISIDQKTLNEIAEMTLSMMNEVSERIMNYVDEPFNLNSPKQLAAVLFDKLGLPANKKRSTSVEVLEKLQGKHPIIDDLMVYRKVAKQYSTYAEGLKKYIHEDGRIHTEFNQCVTQTGRLSSTHPNLQNISVRDEQSRLIRKAFVPSENHVLMACDYSQVELRVLAHIAEEEGLIEAFVQGLDIHTKTAMDLFKVSENEVTSLMRRQAKAVNFGIVYGISDFGLAQQIDVTRKEAQQFIDRYFESYPKILTYTESTIEECREKGYVKTLCGRRREIPEINDRNYMIREFGKRAATNARIQGTAADLIKLAMIAIDDRMKKEQVHSKMILQVHDELIFDVLQGEEELMKRIIEEEMIHAMELKVPLVAECKSGNSWYEVK
ncbi:MAG: DNA polymerase I [Erysipelotrichaceae bacterium]|nr:DNA polymerase I [Erysipelotrichaceae bacterium]